MVPQLNSIEKQIMRCRSVYANDVYISWRSRNDKSIRFDDLEAACALTIHDECRKKNREAVNGKDV